MILLKLILLSLSELNKCVGNACEASVVIKHFNDEIQLFTNFTAMFKGFKYTISQVRKTLKGAGLISTIAP